MIIKVQILGIVIFAFLAIGLFVYFVALPAKGNSPDIGSLTERVYQWSDEDGSLPKFTDVTSIWGLDKWQNTSKMQLRGAVAIADINNDGHNDIILGGGGLAVFLSSSDGKFIKVDNSENIMTDEVVSVGYGDVDGDKVLDILIGTDGREDVIIWGGDWIESYDMAGAELTTIQGGRITTNLIAAELSGDDMIDILSLGYGLKRSVSDDAIFEQTSTRNFRRIVLPNSRRYTLAAEVADINADGELDIWATRDVGWRQGADSLYARINESWQDQANTLGTNLRVDGMDIAIADYNNDGTLDAYVSDVGDNELLLNDGNKFVKDSTLGLARIRPIGSDISIISSTWASGIADFNLDGRLDLLIVNGGFRDDFFENKIDGTEVLVNDPPALLMQKNDGTYADVWNELGIEWDGTSRGLSIGDLDNDGDADFIVMNYNSVPKVYRNDTDKKALKISISPTCSLLVGSTLLVKGQDGKVILTAFPSRSFLGAHAPELATAMSEDTYIEVVHKGQVVFSETLIDLEKPHVLIPCS